MAAGADLFELLGPPSDEQVRRLIVLLRLAPGQRPIPAPKPAEQESDAA
jgi:hypothetical protein